MRALLLALALAAPALAQWEETAHLVASDGVFDSELGHAVATDGLRAVVGAHLADVTGKDSGAAYVFDVATGAELAKLLPVGSRKNDRFGTASCPQTRTTAFERQSSERP